MSFKSLIPKSQNYFLQRRVWCDIYLLHLGIISALQIAGIYPKGPIIVSKYFHEEHLAFWQICEWFG